MRALDLFCCCGGAAFGLRNKFDHITGVDITSGHQYPFNFIQSDVFELPLSFFDSFDFIWASPPCQHYCPQAYNGRNNRNKHPDLVSATRELLLKTGKPFVIENVQGAPLRKDLMLCGEMFGLRTIRHRYFEINGFTVLQSPRIKHRGKVIRSRDDGHYYYAVLGHEVGSMKEWQDAIGIDWITKKHHLAQAVPPKYSSYIISFFKVEAIPMVAKKLYRGMKGTTGND